MLQGRVLAGVLLVVVAGVGWGSMGVVGQYLMHECAFNPTDLVVARLIGAGLFLLSLEAVRRPHKVRLAFANRTLRRMLLVYGVGMLMIQWTFFLAIQTSNAGTAAIMVMTAPIFIVLYFLVSGRPVVATELISIVLALVGVLLIVTKGSLDTMNFSFVGALWGLASAAGGAFCTLYPQRAMRRVGVTTGIGIGMTVGGLILGVFYPPWDMNVVWTFGTIVGYVYIVLVGTVAAFWCYFKSMEFISPTATSVLTAFEPLSAVLLSVWWLNVTMTMTEWIGAGLILLTVVLLGWGSPRQRQDKGQN